jgi:carbonic anhydrase
MIQVQVIDVQAQSNSNLASIGFVRILLECKYIIIVNQTEAKNMKAQYLNQKRETDRENEQRREHMEAVGVKPSQYRQWKPDSSMLGMAFD